MDNEEILYQHNNTDNIFNRCVIGGLLYLLNHRLTYTQTWQDNVEEKVTVPFMYNIANNKQNQDFLQDNYTFFGRECFSDKIIDGAFNMLPRFVISYTGSQINANEITNRFIKGTFTKEEDGKIVSYTAFMYSIPLTFNFDVEGWVDNIDTAFKLEEAIRNTFYKNQTFNVLYRGMKIGCRVGFPEQISMPEKTVSYAFENEAQLKMTFSLALECYQPCFDNSTAIKADNKMEHIGFDISHYTGSVTPKDKKVSLKFKGIDTSKKYATGTVLPLKWDYSSNVSDVESIFLYYITEDGDKHIIDTPIIQTGSFNWTIPTTISKYAQPDIVFIDNDINVIEEPIVNVVPDSSGNVGTGSFVISKPGKFSGSGYVQVSCEYIDDKGKIKIHDCYVASVDSNNGVTSIVYYTDAPDQGFIITNKKKMKYSKNSFVSKITLGITYPLDLTIKDEIDNLLII